MARDELGDIKLRPAEINALEKRIGSRVRAVASSLLTIYGCAELTAAKIIGETAMVSRFSNEAAFASFAGLAPTPRFSGGKRVRTKMGFRAVNRPRGVRQAAS